MVTTEGPVSLKPWTRIPETRDGEIKPVTLTSQQSVAPYLLEEIHKTEFGSLDVHAPSASWVTDTILGTGVTKIYKISSRP